jgi:signal peptidase I
MCEIKRVKAAEMFSVIQELLSQGGKASIIVTGMSMYPFLREDKDSVELGQTSFKSIKRGDIVLIRRISGEYVLHRVLCKEKDVFYIIGDAQRWIEGPLKPEQLIAVVVSVKRRGYTISCKAVWWKVLTGLWLNMIPIRHWFLKAFERIGKLRRYIKNPG